MRRARGETRALILNFLEDHHYRCGRMPTVKQICSRLNIGHAAVLNQLRHLERAGAIIIHPRGTLALTLKGEQP